MDTKVSTIYSAQKCTQLITVDWQANSQKFMVHKKVYTSKNWWLTNKYPEIYSTQKCTQPRIDDWHIILYTDFISEILGQNYGNPDINILIYRLLLLKIYLK